MLPIALARPSSLRAQNTAYEYGNRSLGLSGHCGSVSLCYLFTNFLYEEAICPGS